MPKSLERVYIAHDGRKFHKSKGCYHLRYARRRNKIAVVPRVLVEKYGDLPCKTCYPENGASK